MQKLNYPSFTFKLKTNENKTLIFDIVRKKYVTLTPEEWVRQNTIHYLFKEKNYPISLMAVEKQLKIRTLRKRIDIVSYTNDGIPFLIVECKAPSVQISQDTFDQIARYNLKLEAQILMVTNGISHYYCVMNHKKQAYEFLSELPDAQF
ncbi:MAG: type I restriction enzyme HsdR N-terminal domain-containing protein [Flavobacteriales bacterium]|nr:type I restriction enzyme HsdR N-terminal domain-containing protein [Flavobacteriales bacterium]NQY00560.1 type I restriction enzyme HsdR N-terminal domain-containing protein [Flavobacteriaceae bacterium]